MSPKKTAIFPGTFDPFTIGHLSIVKRGLELLDEIIIAIGVNEAKSSYYTIDERLVNARFILRGIRTVNDFEYERTIADVNREMTGIETIILFTEPQHTHISSTIVRELLRYGKDPSEFVPRQMKLIIRK